MTVSMSAEVMRYPTFLLPSPWRWPRSCTCPQVGCTPPCTASPQTRATHPQGWWKRPSWTRCLYASSLWQLQTAFNNCFTRLIEIFLLTSPYEVHNGLLVIFQVAPSLSGTEQLPPGLTQLQYSHQWTCWHSGLLCQWSNGWTLDSPCIQGDRVTTGFLIWPAWLDS